MNLFVGPNNSRKSRFCRELLTREHLLIADAALQPIVTQLQSQLEILGSEFLLTAASLTVNAVTTLDPEHFNVEKHPELLPAREYALLKNQSATRLDYASFEAFSRRLEEPVETSEQVNKLVDDVAFLSASLSVALKYTAIASRGFNIQQFLVVRVNARENPLQKQNVIQAIDDIAKLKAELQNCRAQVEHPPFLYIPVLRGALPVRIGDNSKPWEFIPEKSYEDTVRQRYGLNSKNDLAIFTGLDLYSRIKRLRNNKKEIRESFEAFEKFLSRRFFSNRHVDIIASDEERTIHLYVGGETERELHNVGDGIQSLIVLLFPIFMSKSDAWVVVEEPEIHLHPGLQTLFVETLLNDEFLREKSLTYFITTHSNHLLDYSLTKNSDVSIFTFRPISERSISHSVIRQVQGPDISILDLLGVANSSVFMAQCTIWVEGITDRIILGAYLKAYFKHLKETRYIENLHYAFFEYAGSNIRHYTPTQDQENDGLDKRIKAFMLANRIWMLADHDSSKEKKAFHNRMKSLIRPGFEYHTTQALEIENTLPTQVLQLFIDQVLGSKTSSRALEQHNPRQSKSKQLAPFIDRVIARTSAQAKKRRTSGSHGTMKTHYKTKLAHLLSDGVDSDEIDWKCIATNPYAKRITVSLYAFLKKNAVVER